MRPERKTHLVFIKPQYVRDAQIYIRDNHLDIADDNDIGWADINAQLLVAIVSDCTQDMVKSYLKKRFPDANPKIFKIMTVSIHEY